MRTRTYKINDVEYVVTEKGMYYVKNGEIKEVDCYVPKIEVEKNYTIQLTTKQMSRLWNLLYTNDRYTTHDVKDIFDVFEQHRPAGGF